MKSREELESECAALRETILSNNELIGKNSDQIEKLKAELDSILHPLPSAETIKILKESGVDVNLIEINEQLRADCRAMAEALKLSIGCYHCEDEARQALTKERVEKYLK